jgi:large subunit ribosomal protein L6
MSRIGKKPVVIPSGVIAKLDGQTIAVKGAKGELKFTAPQEVAISINGGAVHVTPHSEDKRARSQWGTARAQIQNLVGGVTKGFEKKLEINGVGYKAAVAGKNLQLSLGYSHDVVYPIPAGVTITTAKPTEITVSGVDKRQVGQIAAEIRAFRPPEPYKGKGVKYAGEFIFRKEGKKK